MFYLDRSFNLKQKKREFSQILTVDKNGNMTAKKPASPATVEGWILPSGGRGREGQGTVDRSFTSFESFKT